MAFFQPSVVSKYISTFNISIIDDKYGEYVKYFHDADIQENIRTVKEEQFQEGFLRELFVNILEYTINPNKNYNVTTEFKNEKGAKKADGAVLVNGKAVAVIELKDMKTTNLDSINDQAFGYKNNHANCVYIITSNFQKLRFYIHNAVEYVEFNLFELSRDEFNLLWLCLHKDNIISGLPEKIKSESIVSEENITKELYKDYSEFKNDLWLNIIKNHKKSSHLLLYKKTQKLLDRILFILFAEDGGLLPPNSISKMIHRWERLKEEDAYKPLYEIFKQYFSYIDKGRKDKNPQEDIFAYNGGLFEPDDILDQFKIDDDVILPHVKKLTAYDFKSEVDVNILGRIFENSLNDIDAIKSAIEDEVDKGKISKRKKDGVFYTPSYITKYIVEDTIGRLCLAKKEEFEIDEREYVKNIKGRKKTTIHKLLENLNAYRTWLLNIKVCDPACGSGAFLNQALSFLIAEHAYIDELELKLTGSSLVLKNISDHILENNLFGVDVNEESVEIAKLSLWLRTAQKGRKLTSLNNNIKCGNSLINNKAVAKDKAFRWEAEFAKVFENGGFDVVIGNPPYLRVQGLRENFDKETKYFEKNYQSATGRFDIYVLFLEKSYQLINSHGVVSFILPHKFMVGEFGTGIRKYLLDEKAIDTIVHFGSDMVFSDASTYTCIIKLSKNNEDIKFKKIKPEQLFSKKNYDIAKYESLSCERWSLHDDVSTKCFDKLYTMPYTVNDIFSAIRTGVDTGTDSIFILEGEIKGDYFYGCSDRLGETVVIESFLMKPLLTGKDVRKYGKVGHDVYVIYPHYEKDGSTIPYEPEYFEEKFPKSFEYLSRFKKELTEKKINKKTNKKYWYSLHRSRAMCIFEQEKIITPETSLGCNLTIDTGNYYHNTQAYSFIKNESIAESYKFWLAILNSNILWYFLKQTGAILRGGYFRFKTKHLEPFPVPKLKNINDQNPFVEKVSDIMKKTEELDSSRKVFIRYINSQIPIENITKKLINWHEIEFKEFVLEINKFYKKSTGRTLSKSEEFEWMEIFEKKQKAVKKLKDEIKEIDRDLNRMVYNLYGLTSEEIMLVEEECEDLP